MTTNFRDPKRLLSAPLALMALTFVAFSLNSMLLPSTSFAQEDTKEVEKDEAKKVSPSKQISNLKSELRSEIADLSEDYADAKDDEARQAVIVTRRAMEQSIVASLLKITKERSSKSRNVRDLVWFVNRTKGVARETLYNELMEVYADSPDLDDLAKALAKSSKPDEQVEKWLVELIEKSPKEKVKGAATLALIDYLEKLQVTLSSPNVDDTSEYLNRRSEDELSAEIDTLLKTCVEDFADTKFGRSTVGATAAMKLAQMNLKVGRVAPDIVGVDLDDVEFKLSDYRGKVVMIDFWGDW
jgi:hypothetical protein